MSKIVAITFVLSLLLGCAEKPGKTYFVYEGISSKCFKVYEFKDRLEYEDFNCQDVPETADFRVIQEFEGNEY